MTLLGKFVGCVCLAAVVSACGSSDVIDVNCPGLGVDSVLPAPVVSPTGTWDVTYTATSTGGASVTALQWRDETGTLVPVTPPPPTRTKVMTSLPAGTRVTMAAVATAPSGTVSLEVVAVSGPVGAQETIRQSASCGQ